MGKISLGTKKKMFYIIKDGWYYRPNARGYTKEVNEAGEFDYDEMKSHLEHCKELISKEVWTSNKRIKK